MIETVVGLFDSNSRQIVENAVTIKANVKEMSKAMEHPTESGSSFVDQIINLPVDIDLSIILKPEDYQNTYKQLKKLWTAKTLLTVQTKVDRYPRMVVVAMPHEESADLFDTIAIAVSLREVKLVKAQYGTVPLEQGNVKNPADSSTVNGGQKQQKSAAKDLLDKAISAIRG